MLRQLSRSFPVRGIRCPHGSLQGRSTGSGKPGKERTGKGWICLNCSTRRDVVIGGSFIPDRRRSYDKAGNRDIRPHAARRGQAEDDLYAGSCQLFRYEYGVGSADGARNQSALPAIYLNKDHLRMETGPSRTGAQVEPFHQPVGQIPIKVQNADAGHGCIRQPPFRADCVNQGLRGKGAWVFQRMVKKGKGPGIHSLCSSR